MINFQHTPMKHIQSIAQKFFTTSRGSHDWEHTLRVHTLALHIGQREHADIEIIELAAFLHDIARAKEDKKSGRIDHAVLGAKLASQILKKLKYTDKKISAVAHCIESHRFRNNHIPKTLEAKVLFDADKLDSIGAVGIGRAFLFAGEIGAKLHNHKTDLSKTKAYTVEDTAYREFMVKLRHVKKHLLTKEGRRIATSRHKFMVEFFRRLNSEVEGKL